MVSMSLLQIGKPRRQHCQTGRHQTVLKTHENRFWIRPSGVVSKKLMGACRMPSIEAWWSVFETL